MLGQGSGRSFHQHLSASELKRISQPWKVECRVRNPDLLALTFTQRQMYQQKKRGHKTVSKSMKHLSVFESTIVLLCGGWLCRKLVCSKGLSWLFSNSRLWSCCSVFGWEADHYGHSWLQMSKNLSSPAVLSKRTDKTGINNLTIWQRNNRFSCSWLSVH